MEKVLCQKEFRISLVWGPILALVVLACFIVFGKYCIDMLIDQLSFLLADQAMLKIVPCLMIPVVLGVFLFLKNKNTNYNRKFLINFLFFLVFGWLSGSFYEHLVKISGVSQPLLIYFFSFLVVVFSVFMSLPDKERFFSVFVGFFTSAFLFLFHPKTASLLFVLNISVSLNVYVFFWTLKKLFNGKEMVDVKMEITH